ncbi:MAG: hypothetical protein HLUCCA04_00780 [Oceanicaulis sp. HLUCCA04]|nr:MAG: hypothetical protein HLUCCA04_00780 [Oceanicaulis sp. HLUCCA04]
MFSVAIELLHWIAGAVLAVVGIGYDRVEECAPAVRQQTIEEARLMDDSAPVHLASEVHVEQIATGDGNFAFVVRTGAVQEASGCTSAPRNLPSARSLPVMRL